PCPKRGPPVARGHSRRRGTALIGDDPGDRRARIDQAPAEGGVRCVSAQPVRGRFNTPYDLRNGQLRVHRPDQGRFASDESDPVPWTWPVPLMPRLSTSTPGATTSTAPDRYAVAGAPSMLIAPTRNRPADT